MWYMMDIVWKLKLVNSALCVYNVNIAEILKHSDQFSPTTMGGKWWMTKIFSISMQICSRNIQGEFEEVSRLRFE